MPRRRGLSVVELLVVIGIIGAVVALLLPAVAAQRETARKTQCASRLAQVGLALHAYHDSYAAFPSGHLADLKSGSDGKSWGWGALLLPFIEQRPLADRLGAKRRTLDEVGADPKLAPLLQTDIDRYRCPSDQGDRLSHRFRSIFVPGAATEFLLGSRDVSGDRTTGGHVMAHVSPPPELPVAPEEKIDAGAFPLATRLGRSNYVASIGVEWKPRRVDWGAADFKGNGLFGRNSSVRHSQVADGASNTLAVGERSDRNYAAVWAGGNSWEGCGFSDNQMVLATAAYPINDPPLPENIDCDGRGAANFSSHHPNGANFVFADGSVHFLSEQIDALAFERLARRDDGENVGDF